MNTQEALKYEQRVIMDAKRWATYSNGSIDSLEDLAIICERYNMRMPKYLKNFVCSDSRSSLTANGCYKRIYSFLDKLAARIQEEEPEVPPGMCQ